MAHHHGHHHGNEPLETKNIRLAFILNLSFTFIEIAGGLFTNSMAILSDAAHDLGDAVSLGIAWYFQHLSGKEVNENYTYGYRRYSVLGAFVTLFILLFGCAFILYESIPRLIHPEEVKAEGMILLAVFGIGVNFLAMLQMRKGHSLNEKVVSLHFLEDVLGWVAVLIGSVVMYFFDLPIIDPILSIGIAIYILYNVYGNLKVTLQVLLQRTPHNVDLKAIKEKILNTEEVIDCVDMHCWSLDGSMNVMTAKIIFRPGIPIERIDTLIHGLHEELHEYNIHHSTLESRTV